MSRQRMFGIILLITIQFSLIHSVKHIPWTELDTSGNWATVCFNNGVVELKLQGPADVWIGIGFGSGPPGNRMENVPIVAYSAEMNETNPPQLNDHYSTFQGEPLIDSRDGNGYTDDWITDSDTVDNGQRTICAHRMGYVAPDPEPIDKTFDTECTVEDIISAHGAEANGLFQFLYHFPNNRGYNQITCMEGMGLCCRTLAPTGSPITTPTGSGDGDPHFVTMDGLHYNYDGPCSYMLLTNKCSDEDESSLRFEIISHHSPAGKKHQKIYIIKQITIMMWIRGKKTNKQKLELKTGNRVFMDGKLLHLPYNNTLIRVSIAKTRVRGESLERIHLQTSFGLNFYWTNARGASMDVYVPRKIKTCGLLGNSNGNTKDDLQLKNGTILDMKLPLNQKLVDIMGDSWLYNMPNQPLRCSLYPEHSYSSMDLCTFDKKSVIQSCETMLERQFKKLTGRGISKCFANTEDIYNSIDTKRVYDDCITEICACKKDQKDCVPKIAISEFKHACEKNGVSFPDIKWSV